MARTARKQLADMRAMEEEDMRITMRGSGKHFYGAGATPSMGLSQFRGGRKVKYESESESEEEYEGGQISSIAARLAARFAPRAATTSTALVPRVASRVAARPTSTAIIPLGPLGRPVATPSLSARQYGRMFQRVPTASPFVRGATTAVTRAAKRFGPTAARAAALGTTLGAVGSYLGDQFGADDAGDTGYFDDYAGEEYGDEYYPPTTGEFAPEGTPLIPAEGAIPEGLTPDELAWYLQSGNLPMRYAAASSKRQRGKGKKGKGKLELEITHGDMEGGRLKSLRDALAELKKQQRPAMESIVSKLRKSTAKTGAGKKVNARAEVVRRVMKERGCSLPQASKMVKEEGLYTK
jgi:hypothetical protein